MSARMGGGISSIDDTILLEDEDIQVYLHSHPIPSEYNPLTPFHSYIDNQVYSDNIVLMNPDSMISFFRRIGNNWIDAMENYQKCYELGIISKEDFFLEIIKDRGILDILNLSIDELDNISKYSGLLLNPSNFISDPCLECDDDNDGGELIESIQSNQILSPFLPSPLLLLPMSSQQQEEQQQERQEEQQQLMTTIFLDQYSERSTTENILELSQQEIEVETQENERHFHSQQHLQLQEEEERNHPISVQEISHWDLLYSTPVLQIFNEGKSIRCNPSIMNDLNSSIYLECHGPITLITIRIELESFDMIPHRRDKQLIFGVLSETDVDEAYCSSSYPFSRNIWGSIDSRYVRFITDGSYGHSCMVYDSSGFISSIPHPEEREVGRLNRTELSLIVDRTTETCSFLWNGKMKYVFDIPWGIPAVGVSLSSGLIATLTSDTNRILQEWNSSPRPNLSLPSLNNQNSEYSNDPQSSFRVAVDNLRARSDDSRQLMEDHDVELSSQPIRTVRSSSLSLSSSSESTTLRPSFASTPSHFTEYNDMIQYPIENNSTSISNQSSESTLRSISLSMDFDETIDISMPNIQPKTHSRRNDDTEHNCCVCLQRPKCVVLIPCRHLCLCEYCSEDDIEDCPLCRNPIEHRLQVFV